MKKVHILPTDKPSRITILKRTGKLLYDVEPFIHDEYDVITNQNIYITSDEEIKEGDYIFETDTNKVNIADKDYYINEFDFKIILTTDQDLIKDGVQAIGDEFLEWFVKNPSCEKAEVNFNNRGITGTEKILKTFGEYKIIIPQEEPKQEMPIINGSYGCIIETNKQETLEQAAENYANYNEQINKAVQEAVKFGAKYQSERMYSEEEVLIILDKFLASMIKGEKTGLLNQWFEQFKKK